jgi:uncharacterized phage protein (TIGR02218 family)
MKNISTDLLNLLNSKVPLYWVDLYTIQLANNTTVRYTNADRVISFGGNSWLLGPTLSRTMVRITGGIEVSTMKITMSDMSGTTISGLPFMQYVGSGGLDNAFVTLERGFSGDPSLASIVGKMTVFTGRVADLVTGRHVAEVNIKAPTELLDTKIPRNLYQPGCHNTLYDDACGLVKTSYGAIGNVTSTSTKQVINSDIATSDGVYSLGVLKYLTGTNAGLSYTVKQQVGGQITLIAQSLAAPSVGNQFVVYPGCDKTAATCKNKFSNITRFRGQPFIPVPETIA